MRLLSHHTAGWKKNSVSAMTWKKLTATSNRLMWPSSCAMTASSCSGERPVERAHRQQHDGAEEADDRGHAQQAAFAVTNDAANAETLLQRSELRDERGRQRERDCGAAGARAPAARMRCAARSTNTPTSQARATHRKSALEKWPLAPPWSAIQRSRSVPPGERPRRRPAPLQQGVQRRQRRIR